MLENIQAYLSKQGVKYIKPEKAGPHQGRDGRPQGTWSSSS